MLEATFSTLGQALAETGRRAASAIDALDIDGWFTSPPRSYASGAGETAEEDEPPPMAATPADLKKTASREDAPEAPDADEPPSKTAGKGPQRRPPADDETPTDEP